MYRRRCTSPSVRHRGMESPCSHTEPECRGFYIERQLGETVGHMFYRSGCWSDVCPLSSVVERASSILVTKYSRLPRHISKASPSLLSAETRSVGAHHLRDDRKPQVAHPFQRLCAIAACTHAAFLARERKCLFLGVTTWPFSRVRRTCSGRQAGRPAEQALTSRCHCIFTNRF